MVTISCAFRYSVRGRSTGTLISTLAPDWSVPETRSVNRGSNGFGTIRGAVIFAVLVMPAQYDIPGQPDISIEIVLIRLKFVGGERHENDWASGLDRPPPDHPSA